MEEERAAIEPAQVVAAGGVDLMEAAIAREILSAPKPDAFGPLPSGVALP